jgi:putative protease
LKPGQIELLAPARDAQAGRNAIDCGADALYIGAPRFGAREQAGNSLAEIEELIRYAHRYWSRIYITLNTLLHDHELDQAVSLTRQLYEMGADGLIIQDFGLLESGLPPIPLIASTQMHNHTLERVAFLEKMDFQRVILARELSLDQIRTIRQGTRIELECFIHGALCVSYSGQCYLSLARGGRSGNRGQCAQPCRLPYRLVDGADRPIGGRQHLLSLRDLNLSGHLAELLSAGITSFKIEGRLKDDAYVKNIVTFYRRRLDALLGDRGLRPSSSGHSTPSFTPDPMKSFNRGYTTYFLKGRDRTMTAHATPKNIGESLGAVDRCEGGILELQPGAPQLHNGDGLTWFDRQGVLQGVRVNRVEGKRGHLDKPLSLPPGTRIARNHDHDFLEVLRRSKNNRHIFITLELGETGRGYRLVARDEDGISAEMTAETELESARDPEQAIRIARTCLTKSGGTPFVCREVLLTWQQPRFLPLSQLNGLRRDLLDALLEARLRAHPLVRVQRRPDDIPYPEKRLSYTGNVLNRRARAFYERHGVTEITPAAESGIDLHGQRVMTTRYCIRGELGLCKSKLQAGGFIEPLFLIDDQDQRLRLDFRCDACEMDLYLA